MIEQIDLQERFYIFDSFLKSNEHILQRGDDEWDSSKIFFQLSIEHADKSPLSIDAEKYEDDGKVDFDYVRDVNRDEEIYISPLVAILEGNEFETQGILELFNKDILSYGANETKVWHTNSFECKAVIEKKIRSAIQLHNGDIVSFSLDANLSIWDTNNYTCKLVLTEHLEDILGVIELQNKDMLSYSIDGTIVIWDISDNYKQKLVIQGEDNYLYEEYERYYKIIQLKNGDILVYRNNDLDNDGVVKVLNSTNYQEKDILDWHETFVYSFLKLDNDNLLVISGVSYYDISILDNDLKLLGTLEGHNDGIYGAIQLQNGDILSYSVDTTLRIWDINTFKCKAILEGHNDSPGGVIQLKNGDILSYSYGRGFEGSAIFIIWDKNTYKPKMTFEGHNDRVEDIIQLKDEKIISLSNDGNIICWDIKNFRYSNKKMKYSMVNFIVENKSRLY